LAEHCEAARRQFDYEAFYQSSKAGADLAVSTAPGQHGRFANWQVYALFMLGRGAEAKILLEEIESRYGKSFATRRRAADIQFYLGNFEAALHAADEAICAIPLNKAPGKAFVDLCSRKAAALCALGRHGDARRFLLAVWRDKPALTPEDVALLRTTVVDEESLAAFRDYLSTDFFTVSRCIPALQAYSTACRDLGLMDEAIYAARQKFLAGAELFKPGDKKPPSSKGWTAAARRALLDLKADFTGAGADFFLISGTLLGCMREGDLLGHDTDIDVGVTPCDLDGLRRRLQATGRFAFLRRPVPGLLQIRHCNGVAVDIFEHREQDGAVVHQGRKCRWINSPFGLTSTSFLGGTFTIPDRPEAYLQENYGDWRQPALDFDTFVDTPNMEVTSAPDMTHYLYGKLLDYYRLGRMATFARVWNALQAVSPPDARVRAAAEGILKEVA
jgi:hypothetical protein